MHKLNHRSPIKPIDGIDYTVSDIHGRIDSTRSDKSRVPLFSITFYEKKMCSMSWYHGQPASAIMKINTANVSGVYGYGRVGAPGNDELRREVVKRAQSHAPDRLVRRYSFPRNTRDRDRVTSMFRHSSRASSSRMKLLGMRKTAT